MYDAALILNNYDFERTKLRAKLLNYFFRCLSPWLRWLMHHDIQNKTFIKSVGAGREGYD